MIYTKRDKQVILEFLKKSNLLGFWIMYIHDNESGLPSHHITPNSIDKLEKFSKNIIGYFGMTCFTDYVYKKTNRKLKYNVSEYFAKFLHDNYYKEYADKCSDVYYFRHTYAKEQLF